MFQPLGNGIFQYKSDERNTFTYDNTTMIVYYEFMNEGKIELEIEDIPQDILEMLEKIGFTF